MEVCHGELERDIFKKKALKNTSWQLAMSALHFFHSPAMVEITGIVIQWCGQHGHPTAAEGRENSRKLKPQVGFGKERVVLLTDLKHFINRPPACSIYLFILCF